MMTSDIFWPTRALKLTILALFAGFVWPLSSVAQFNLYRASQTAVRQTHRIQFSDAVRVDLQVITITDPRSPRNGLTICWVRIPLDALRLDVVEIGQAGKASTLLQSRFAGQAGIIVNGGMYQTDRTGKHRPEGLVVSSSREVVGVAPWTTGGVLRQRDGIIDIVPIANYKQVPIPEEAIQSKPIIVLNGRNDMRGLDRGLTNRLVVGLTSDRMLLIAGAFAERNGGVTLYEFAEYLQIPVTRGGPGAMVALGMDGGPNAQIYVPSIGLRLGDDDDIYLPEVLHLVPRSSP